MRKRVTVGTGPSSYLEAGSGPLLLVLIHGFPLHAEMWEPQLEAVPRGWRIVAPDLRGFGPAAASASRRAEAAPSLDDYADDVLALMDALGLARAVIGGLSMGGYVTFALFRKAPERFAGVVLADTRPQPDTDEGRANRQTMRDVLARDGVDAVVRDMLPTLVGESTRRQRPDVERRVHALASVNGRDGLDAALVAMMHRPDSTPQLGAMRGPSLVVVGAEDALTPPAEAQRMQQAIAGARLQVVPEAGHLSNLENPAAFNAALFQFLKEGF